MLPPLKYDCANYLFEGSARILKLGSKMGLRERSNKFYPKKGNF